MDCGCARGDRGAADDAARASADQKVALEAAAHGIGHIEAAALGDNLRADTGGEIATGRGEQLPGSHVPAGDRDIDLASHVARGGGA